MIEKNFFETLAKKITTILPDNCENIKSECEKNIKATIQTALGKLNLITREEFDAQARILKKCKEQIAELERKLAK